MTTTAAHKIWLQKFDFIPSSPDPYWLTIFAGKLLVGQGYILEVLTFGLGTRELQSLDNFKVLLLNTEKYEAIVNMLLAKLPLIIHQNYLEFLLSIHTVLLLHHFP
jgi:hypothetical protein